MRASVALFVVAAACAAQARAQLPETPAGRQFAAWLAIFNHGDRDSLRAFVERSYPTAVPRIEQTLNFRERTGGFELIKVSESTPLHLVAYVQERSSDQFAQATVDVDSTPAHLITMIGINAIPRPA